MGIVTTLRIGQSRVLNQRVKWPGSEVDHSPPTTADVRNEWHYTSTHGMDKNDLFLPDNFSLVFISSAKRSLIPYKGHDRLLASNFIWSHEQLTNRQIKLRTAPHLWHPCRIPVMWNKSAYLSWHVMCNPQLLERKKERKKVKKIFWYPIDLYSAKQKKTHTLEKYVCWQNGLTQQEKRKLGFVWECYMCVSNVYKERGTNSRCDTLRNPPYRFILGHNISFMMSISYRDFGLINGANDYDMQGLVS